MKKANLLTIIAISALSWILVNITHEFFGHAVFGILCGLKLKAVSTSTAYLDVNWENYTNQYGFIGLRFFLLGGVLMNFITGLIVILIQKFKKPSNSNITLFLWLFASFSLVIIVMNLISVTLIGGGDLPGVISTFNNQDTAKIVVLIIGLFIMIAGYIMIQKSFMPKMKGHRSILASITLIPVLTVIIVQTLSLLMSPFAYLQKQLKRNSIVTFSKIMPDSFRVMLYSEGLVSLSEWPPQAWGYNLKSFKGGQRLGGRNCEMV